MARARAWVAAPCIQCGKKGVTDDPATFIHDWCRGKPQPCECGQPSMPYPLCTWCKGSGLIDKETCLRCPLGPCVGCVIKALIARTREARDGAAEEG
jgi:hypothetical protein